MDGQEILLAARELFAHGNYSSVVAVCSDVLAEHPHVLGLRLLLARALMALKQDEEALDELDRCVELAPTCAEAYRLLGKLALRQGELESATFYLRQAVRHDPHDAEASSHLARLSPLNQPTAAVEKLPAATVAVGCASPNHELTGTNHELTGTNPELTGTRRRFALGSESGLPAYDQDGVLRGFGEYLVQVGVLSRAQLDRALVHHRISGLRIGSAAVELGFVSQPKVEWAALAYHSQAG